MSKRKSFILYSDLKEKLGILNKEQKGELFQAILEYQCGIEEQDLDLSDLSRLAFSFIKSDLDTNNEKYEKVVAARQEAGSIGGTNASNARKKIANGSKAKQTVANSSKAKNLVANSSVNENGNGNENEVNKLTDKEKPKKEIIDFEDLFNEFWKQYPKGKDKQLAKNKFRLKLKQYGQERLFSQLQGYKKQIEFEGTELAYIKNPATWLNQGLEDDYNQQIQQIQDFKNKAPPDDLEKRRKNLEEYQETLRN